MKQLLAFFSLLLLLARSLSSNDMGISLETNYRNYHPSQSIKIKVKLQQPAYLYILTLQSNGNLNLLFPNEDEQDNMVLEDELQIPSDAKDYEFLAGETFGKDTIIAIASRNRIKKLHREKYRNKPIYKNVSTSNLSWLKKLTKKLPPEQWVSADINIFISKDNKTEIAATPIPPSKKESKIITANYSQATNKKNEKEKKHKEFTINEVMHGYFKLPNSVKMEGNKRGYFSILKDPDINKYKLKIIPYLANPNDICEYSIVSFTDPKKVTGTYGTVTVVPAECNLQKAEQEHKEFWQKITNFYLQYKFKKSGSLKGNIWLTGPDDKLNQKMVKPEVFDDFKFLE